MSVTAFNRPPYFDDFNTPDSEGRIVTEKGYYRVLFSPAYAVQNRELNQIQTMIQHQIDAFGLSVYENGTPVINGETNFVDDIDYIDIDITNNDLAGRLQYQKFIETRDTPEGNVLLKAEILSIDESLDGSLVRVWIRYQNSPSSGVTSFAGSDTLYLTRNLIILDAEGNLSETNPSIVVGTVDSVGVGFSLSVEAGVFFMKGYFVHTEAVTRYFAKPNSTKTVTGEAIWRINERTITSDTDNTLLDNANGSFNFAAPGADRYQITVDLGLLTNDSDLYDTALNPTGIYDESTTQIDYVRLLSITGSAVYTEARTEYSQLDRVLAERTYEESGNYTVRPFLVSSREFLRENNNGGRYLLSEVNENNPFGVQEKATEAGVSLTDYLRDRMVMEIDPSVAYVEGYRVDLQEKRGVMTRKARTKQVTTDINISMPRGNYIDVVWDPSSSSTIDDLFNETVRSIEFAGVVDNTASSHDGFYRYRIYVYNNYDNLATPIPLPNGFEYRYLPGTVDITDASIKNPENNRSIFALPYVGTSQVQSIEYALQEQFSGSWNIDDTLRIEGGANQVFGGLSRSDFVLFNRTTSKYLDPLDVIDSFTLSTNASVITVTFASGASGLTIGTDAIDIILPVRIDDSNAISRRRNKTKQSASDDLSVLSDGTVILSNQDVIIDSISITGDIDYTVIDDGQGLNFYDNPVLKFPTLSEGDSVTINYDYFDHSPNGDYFVKESYDESGVDFDDLPAFGNSNSRISDFIDFRVKRSVSYDTSSGEIVYGSLEKIPARVVPNSVAEVDIEHYLPRADLLVVDYKSDFFVIEGNPSISPLSPKSPTGAMALYEIYAPPYTYKAEDVDLAYSDNNRYTMADIGKLEKRIQKLEYYSSLSLLEKEATDRKILDLREDTAGVERFKSGILVDSFIGHSVGDVENPDYLCSIDKENGILRPYYRQDNYRLKYTGEVDGSVPATPKLGEIGAEQLSLDQASSTTDTEYRETLFSNLKASQTMSVQPYEVTTWEGSMRLSPSSDEWIDTETRPATTINLEGMSNAIEFIANEADGVLGTEWNAWQNSWQSRSSTSSTSREIDRSRPHGEWIRDTTVTNTTTQTGQTREGIRTEMSFNTVEQSLGERVVDLSIVPWIRSRDVRFRATGLKPNTEVFPFFDGESVADYVRPDSFQPFAFTNEVQTYNGQPAPGGAFGSSLITDDSGVIEGIFRIPNNEGQRFRTGQRVFRLTDNPQNNELETDSFTEAKYNAEGLVQAKETQILSTRVPEFTQTRLEDSRVVVSRNTRTTVNAFDPVAQTFAIGQDHPNGVFLTDIDIFFASKPEDTSLDAEIYLVSVENGIPTTNVVPGSKVRKAHSEVIATGRDPESIIDHPTQFVFDYPIYLQAGYEYAVVVFSKSPEYRIWTSELGAKDLVTNLPITKNPSFGVLLKSQNKRTWTPDQLKDMMMVARKAVFPTNQLKTFTLSTKVNGDNQGMSNRDISLINPNIETMAFPNTSAKFTIQFFDGSGSPISAVSRFGELEAKENYALRSAMQNADHAKITARLETSDPDLSPIVDLERAGLICIENAVVLNEPVAEGGIATGGNAQSRYITRRVSLQNPAEELRVILAVNRPSTECDIHLYAKRMPSSNADQSFRSDLLWQEMPIYSVNSNVNASSIPTITKEDDYAEIEYILPDPDPNVSDSVGEFSDFAVKIVFTSTDAAKICRVRDLRAIASV